MKTLLLVSFLVAITASRCTNNSNANTSADSIQTNTDTSLPQQAITNTSPLSGRWNLIPAMASDTATGRLPYLVFDTGRVSGNTGCNNFSGRYKQSGTTLHFDSNMISTKMACAGYDENTFMNNLLRTTGYDIKSDTLVLKTDVTPVSYWLKGK